MARRKRKKRKSKKKKKWIQGAKLKKGAFTAQAKRAGMGVQAFASRVIANPKRYSATTVRRARLVRTFKRMRKK